ncbi:tetratricopeptide repeat protein [bacterium]|nr:MAG: tetratricopeptide repeat protein [bacterium]
MLNCRVMSRPFLVPAISQVAVILALFGSMCDSYAQNQDSKFNLKREWAAVEKATDRTKVDNAAVNLHLDRIIDEFKVFENKPESFEGRELAQALAFRGSVRFGREDWKGAIEDFNRAIAISPDNAGAYAMRGVARKASGDYDGLIADEQIAARLDPKYKAWLNDAHSTVLWRRVKLGFMLLGIFVLALGGIPFAKSLIQLGKAERQTPQ